MKNDNVDGARLAVIGLGYVGLPLAVAFATSRDVVAFDISEDRIKELNNGIDSTLEFKPSELVNLNRIMFTSDIEDIRDRNIYIIAVPTPVDSKNQPDVSSILSATAMVGELLDEGDLVIYESTVYPGLTEELCVPALEQASGLKFNRSFYVGYSPERVNPGDAKHGLNSIIKLTAGSTPQIAERVDELYREIIDAGTFKVDSIRIAEAAKVIENTQRDLNIALVNELSKLFNILGIDTEKVLQAADTKWNFHRYSPGLVGGHCIGVDPYYLVHKAEDIGYKPEVILAGRNVNDGMSDFVASELIKLLQDRCFELPKASVLVLGMTFKENCGDIRNSKVIDLCANLSACGLDVFAHDPFIDDEVMARECEVPGVDPFESAQKYSAVVLAVAHDQFKHLPVNIYRALLEDNGLIFDLKWMLGAEDSDWRM